jgi:hypothetical protein
MIVSLDRDRVAFNFLKTSRKPIRGRFPDFMIVGPQRTGTTWLSEMLSKHHEVFMSDPKEIYFFNRLGTVGASRSNFYYRFLNETPRLTRRYLNFAIKTIQIDLLRTRWMPADTLDWYLTFFNGRWARGRRKKSTWDSRGRTPSAIKMTGEATASYFIMSEAIIEDIVALNPDIKIIVLIRNPVSRTWSHAKKDLMRASRKRLADVPMKDFMDFCASDYMRECNAYVRHIRKWAAKLKPGHLHCNFYDSLVVNPELFLQSVLEFLEVSSDTRYLTENLSKRVNPTAEMEIPPDIKQFLLSIYRNDMTELEAEYPGKTAY